MTASLETLAIAAYIFADGAAIPRPGPAGKITDAELVALAVAQAAMGESSDRKAKLGLAGRGPDDRSAHSAWCLYAITPDSPTRSSTSTSGRRRWSASSSGSSPTIAGAGSG